MRLNISVALATFAAAGPAAATVVAVVDSGTDFRHAAFQGKAWLNDAETKNLIDDDRNGKVDDIVGWNFIDWYGQVFFPEQQIAFSDHVYKFSELMAKIELGRLTAADKEYWNHIVTHSTDKQKNELIRVVSNFGNYIHGTHTAGIVVEQHPGARIMSLRTIPDQAYDVTDVFEQVAPVRGLDDAIFKVLAQALNQNFMGISQYLTEHEVPVANFSLGTPLIHLARMALQLTGKKNPDDALLQEVTDKMFAQLAASGAPWMQSASKTLMVFASGNDGINTDVFKAFPASVDLGNTITVGASHGTSSLAFFSNYGKRTVHVLAPGSAVVSSVPHDSGTRTLPFSGTSMAAPFVSGVAARLVDANPALAPADLKAILMQTVDVKDYLKDTVMTSGIVNAERATRAAELAKAMSLADAIAAAKAEIADQPVVEPQFAIENAPAAGDVRLFPDPKLSGFINAFKL